MFASLRLSAVVQTVLSQREVSVVKSSKPEMKSAAERRVKMSERRSGENRRAKEAPVAVERRQLERREKVNRRRQIDPTTCERDYSTEEIEFMHAMDQYKRANGRMFPTCSEILEVVRSLGYQKTNSIGAELVETASSDDSHKPLTAIILGEQVPA